MFSFNKRICNTFCNTRLFESKMKWRFRVCLLFACVFLAGRLAKRSAELAKRLAEKAFIDAVAKKQLQFVIHWNYKVFREEKEVVFLSFAGFV